MASLLDLYKKAYQPNPYNRGADMMAGAIGNTPDRGFGYAAAARMPMMWTMGAMAGKGAALDRERMSAYSDLVANQVQQQSDQRQQELASKVFQQVIELSKMDPEAATEILKKEATQNPYLQKFAGIRFTAPTTKDQWMNLEVDGKPYQVWLPGYARMMNDPNTPPEQILQAGIEKKIIIPGGNAAGKTSDVTPEGKRIFGELQDTSQIPDESRGRYEDAMKKNLANESPSLLKQYSEQTASENKPEEWQDWGYGQKRNKRTGEVKKVPTAPRQSTGTAQREDNNFLSAVNQLDGLYKSRASIEKGYDPLTGQVIKPENLDQAKETINGQIADRERFISGKWSKQWAAYRGSPGSQQEQPGEKTLDRETAKKILQQAGGDKEKARQIARRQGYKF
jgi:hypothetical protein